MKKLILSGLVALFAASLANAKELNHLTRDGVAIHGHDPVAFFKAGRPVPGDARHQTTHKGAKYYFSSAENKADFERDPSQYAPQFGGWCAYGIGRNNLTPTKIEGWQIVNGRLLMQKNLEVRDLFNKDPQANLKKADETWPKILEKKGQ